MAEQSTIAEPLVEKLLALFGVFASPGQPSYRQQFDARVTSDSLTFIAWACGLIQLPSSESRILLDVDIVNLVGPSDICS
mmetsp:Transcript_12724/g.28699  ORF Transcript_12724/g.28699 Transcript_12724/m.28699 type:complete len:80 (+) Transcript_12724:1610-1849(+)